MFASFPLAHPAGRGDSGSGAEGPGPSVWIEVGRAGASFSSSNLEKIGVVVSFRGTRNADDRELNQLPLPRSAE